MTKDNNKAVNNKRINIKILLVEDDEMDFENLKYNLKNDFIADVTLVDNLSDFKNQLKTNKFDIIISDHRLVGFTSIDVIKEFNSYRWKFNNIPFIILSGEIGVETAVEAMKLSADDYVMKNAIKKLPFVIKNSIEKYTFKKASEENMIKLTELTSNMLIHLNDK